MKSVNWIEYLLITALVLALAGLTLPGATIDWWFLANHGHVIH